MLDYIKSLVGILWNLWLTVNKRPKVTFDVLGVYRAQWLPDCEHDAEGNVIAEGIRVEAKVQLLLSNSGPVDTTLKGISIRFKYNDAKIGLLLWQHWKDKDIAPGARIMPRGVWGPKYLDFSNVLWDVTELPKILEAELVVEPVAQRPVRRKIKLRFGEE